MADVEARDFGKRVNRINKRHKKTGGGNATGRYVNSVNHDGLVVARVRRRGPSFPWKGVALCFLAFFIFKGFMLAQLGEATYNDRVAKLQAGTVIEQTGAYVMSVDPVTNWVAAQIQSVLR